LRRPATEGGEPKPVHKIHTILTDNGFSFAGLSKNRTGPNIAFTGGHIFGRTFAENGITHKLTKPYHSWTNGRPSG
jgi:hypothetical protein